MEPYEFSTYKTPDGKLIIPDRVLKKIPNDIPVRVIILPQKSTEIQMDESTLTLDSVIKKIQNSRQGSEHIRPASGMLAEHLRNSEEQPDPSFDPEEWNRRWDEVEQMMKADEIAEQEAETEMNLP